MIAEINGVSLELETNSEIFSPSDADKGTLAMLSQVTLSSKDKVLDLGCGCGIVGIYAAALIGADRVVMTDVSPVAVLTAKMNAVHNNVDGVKICLGSCYEDVEDRDFTLILSNPPYHTDFSVAKEFIEGGFKRLVLGGKMVMVTKRLDWYRNKLAAVFGGVRVSEIDGYYVFVAEKRGEKRNKAVKQVKGLSKKLARKYDRKK
ncbi:MAG: methyltransferase [Ruminiclostridium sp.]|nr:methyltransferase [Ruminiclostridium sp.]